MSNEAVKTLLEKKKELENKRDTDFFMASQIIKGIEQSIEELSGKKISDVENQYRYDDENPTYITGTEDGI